jgi:sulfur-oxidizing protein SoxY
MGERMSQVRTTTRPTTLTRRSALALPGGLAALAVCVAPGAAIAQVPAAKNNSADLIRAFTGGRAPTVGRVKLDAPEIAENGNTVPFTVSVESPMTAADHVTDVLVVADGNPLGGICKFSFNPQSGVAEANTRIRLAETQNIIAIAKMSDGSFFSGTVNVKVTIGGCGG